MVRSAYISLNLMAKVPQPGLVKTRLMPMLGAEGAAHAHARLLAHVVAKARAWCAAGPDRLFRLWCTPNTTHPACANLAQVGQLRLQPSGDLGERMAAITRAALAESPAMLLIGGDAVSLTLTDLDAAAQALTTHPAVLGPTEDGGYLLLGLRQTDPSLFRGMAWSTPTVALATRERFGVLGWSWHELPLRWDVDTPADWQRFVATFGG
ncbi:MAG: TIGR04282 family arsenosugar biosynthesis glycosyltransferase [Magnetococcales bacterium]|nr:TIGR04282 family arsenosugar biosynthesis glycosyltransferase [Magnetococcales bacterium]MBF0323125.1 TIGR04282 family arsenosugar biosynthesis glycosyltransferase [Magnetococcales bacterium]